VAGGAVPNVTDPVARIPVGAPWSPRSAAGSAIPAPAPLPAAARGGARLTADVVVIGSGAGGAVAAARFAEAGRDVVLLEEGSLIAPDELTEREGDMTARLYAEGGMRATDDLSIALAPRGCRWRRHARELDDHVSCARLRPGGVGRALRYPRLRSGRYGAGVRARGAGDPRDACPRRRALASKSDSSSTVRIAWAGARPPGASTRALRAGRVLRAGLPLRREAECRPRLCPACAGGRGARFPDVRVDRIALLERDAQRPPRRRGPAARRRRSSVSARRSSTA
jgi:hypothetical protein